MKESPGCDVDWMWSEYRGSGWVDQEGPPGERDAKAGFEEITEFFK